MNTTHLLTATGIGPGKWYARSNPSAAFQATVSGAGSVGATVRIFGSNDGEVAVGTELGTITLSGTNSDSDGFVGNAAWAFTRAEVSAYTAGTVTVRMNEA
jgi:hypothetical protein